MSQANKNIENTRGKTKKKPNPGNIYYFINKIFIMNEVFHTENVSLKISKFVKLH